jgi:SAM-dependent methyltransferase
MAQVRLIDPLKRKFGPRNPVLDLQVGDVLDRALAFEATLGQVKARTRPADFDWYPWDSFGTLSSLDRLLTGRARFLPAIAGEGPIVDVGCGDGALAFFFESLGYTVYAIDHPPTNFNGMRGVRALREALGSSVHIAAADLDRRFRLPARRCGLALFFGILYHLKNPFGALETLAAGARYCLLSTAIARFTPDRGIDMRDAPLAWLAGRDGLKGDETNYWIFSETGLRTLVDRAGWDVCDWMVTGDAGETLWGAEPDLRVFCLLRSRAFPEARRTQLLAGWHKLENQAWRWTARRFSLALEEAGAVTLRLTAPDFLPAPVALTAASNGVPLLRRVFPYPGDHDFTFQAEAGTVEFELDKALEPTAQDGRERGIIVRAVEVS